ncbi:response regulator transcription factor [Romboutsia lituseburensis]|uniref:Stage 0 sporulation protein A homolog n=1 Tax=Romboutsia lituseburensis DSM 797 TaxID=1121325 RepID=A0A1G9J944_9FIRM|nr:response regulator transcription factor [Romboutsia lituseburensis]CEH33593.1 Sensory transduction protein regX3 [Romboutsia lituseburensis]SDL33664.1 DNA-binding response regulator, OmpR family, contains REC and winged-helix (wHTH) domain [Romboutsia lituseburensis DSM 797]
MKILVVEDDLAIRDLIDINLTISGYDVLVAQDGEEGKNIFDKENIDAVLLDVMLPKIDGFELIEHIKKKDVPVIFITAKSSVSDRVKGLKLGADDYIVKPFESIELLARIEAVARRYNKSENIIKVNNIEIDLDRRIVKLDGEIIELTLKEFELLALFVKNKNIALSREQILDKVWGFDYIGETRTIDIHVQRLREKLKLKSNIKTIFKVGYRFEY